MTTAAELAMMIKRKASGLMAVDETTVMDVRLRRMSKRQRCGNSDRQSPELHALYSYSHFTKFPATICKIKSSPNSWMASGPSR
jgi:hypothetical protein